jgi:hypothetical protein
LNFWRELLPWIPEPSKATGGGVVKVISKKFSGHTKNNFPDIPHFFLNTKNIFRIYQKFSGYMIFFLEMKKISVNNMDSSFQKYAFVKKCNLNEQENCTLLPEKGHLA